MAESGIERMQVIRLRATSAARQAQRRRAAVLRYLFVAAILFGSCAVLTLSGLGLIWQLDHAVRGMDDQMLAKKSLPLSSTTMNAGKSTTSIFHTASMPSSGYSSISTFLMQSSASLAAGPPIDPR